VNGGNALCDNGEDGGVWTELSTNLRRAQFDDDDNNIQLGDKDCQVCSS